MLPDAVVAHYRAQQRLTVATLALVRREWARMGDDFDVSWRAVGPRLMTLVAAAQLGAAKNGAAYVPRALAETGQSADAEGDVVPGALSGVASDGRPLESLLYGSVVKAKTAQAGSTQERLDAGRRWLDMATWTQVADAGRGGASVAMAARPAVTGYVRMLNPPSCSRCAVLAGRWYRWNAGFARHPKCDCRHIPATENIAGDFTTSPERYFDSLSKSEQDRIFTNAGAEAIRDGADIGRVVNARRGMSTAQSGRLARRSIDGRDVYTTTEATTRRGTGRKVRLMPESIYEIAEDRADAIRLLKVHGYLN